MVISAVGALALAAAVPFLVPVSSFIPEISAIASAKLGQPVSIGGLRLHLVPTPRVVALDIRVGKNAEAAVGRLEIVPDLLSFVFGPRSIRLIQAEKVALKEAALALPGAMPKSEPGEPLTVRRVVLQAVTLEHAAVKVPEFDVEARLGAGFALESAILETRDKALRLSVEPEGEGVARIALTATQWTLPAGPPLLFEALSARGVLKGSHIDLAQIDGKLYGGTFKASALADWSKLWEASGKAALEGIDLAPVQKALGKAPNLSGRLNATAAFSSRAKAPDGLASALVLDGPFEVLGGAYQGVDLAKAGDLTGRAAAGDATSFEELKGQLRLRGKRVRIDDLCVRSPKVVAGGHVEVAANSKLSGRLDVSVAKTGGFVGVPVTLGGTTEDPSIRPSTGYIVGAAVGTLLLPGIGTTLGASAGSAFEGKSTCK